MLERFIEQKLRRAVVAAGGLCPKFISPGMDGMPDRLILLPGGRVAFVELKAPNKVPRPLQAQRHAQLRDLGFSVFVIDGPDQIPLVLSLLTSKPQKPKQSSPAQQAQRRQSLENLRADKKPRFTKEPES